MEFLVDTQDFTEFVDPVEPVGVPSVEMDGDDVPVVFDALLDEGLGPFRILDDSVDLAGDLAGREDAELSVGGEDGIRPGRQVPGLPAGLVDRNESRIQPLQIHQEVVDLVLDRSMEEIAERADQAHGVDAAQGMVAGDGIPSVRIQAFKTFHLNLDIQVLETFVGEFDPFPALLEEGVQEVLVVLIQ